MNLIATNCTPLASAALLPAKCLGPTWSLDAPCPKCWENPWPDYDPLHNSTELSPQLQAVMSQRLQEYIGAMSTARPASYGGDSGTVFSGVGGRALLLLKLHELTGNATFGAAAEAYVKAMENRLSKQRLEDRVSGFVGFMWSRVGMLCVGAFAAEKRGDASQAAKYVGEVRGLLTSLSGKYDDFDSGRAGLLYASRFLDANLKTAAIPRAPVVALAHAIITRGAATGRAHGHSFLQWHGPNDNGLWLGQSHGSAGILQQLLAVPELASNRTAIRLITATLDHIVSLQFTSGNFPSEYYKPNVPLPSCRTDGHRLQAMLQAAPLHSPPSGQPPLWKMSCVPPSAFSALSLSLLAHLGRRRSRRVVATARRTCSCNGIMARRACRQRFSPAGVSWAACVVSATSRARRQPSMPRGNAVCSSRG